jgi:hypothetical protein
MPNIREKASEDRLKTISDKVKAHEMQLAIVHELYKVIVTGDVAKGEPGMLENNRNTSKALQRIEIKLSQNDELDKRVREIEERHVRIDKENATKADETRRYKFYFITLAASNIVTIAVTLLIAWFKP